MLMIIFTNTYWGLQVSGVVLSALYMLTHLILTLFYAGVKTGANSNLPYQVIMSTE